MVSLSLQMPIKGNVVVSIKKATICYICSLASIKDKLEPVFHHYRDDKAHIDNDEILQILCCHNWRWLNHILNEGTTLNWFITGISRDQECYSGSQSLLNISHVRTLEPKVSSASAGLFYACGTCSYWIWRMILSTSEQQPNKTRLQSHCGILYWPIKWWA